jgi:ABC-type hemin transport system substrate-binding protein
MLTNVLTSRFAGPILLVLAALTLVGGGAFGVQTYRLHNSQNLVASQKQTIGSLNSRILEKDALAESYKLTIAQQNASIDAISKVRSEDRVIYLKQYGAADQAAKGDDARADQLLGLQNTFTDELAQCRASKLLLEQEVGQ